MKSGNADEDIARKRGERREEKKSGSEYVRETLPCQCHALWPCEDEELLKSRTACYTQAADMTHSSLEPLRAPQY